MIILVARRLVNDLAWEAETGDVYGSKDDELSMSEDRKNKGVYWM